MPATYAAPAIGPMKLPPYSEPPFRTGFNMRKIGRVVSFTTQLSIGSSTGSSRAKPSAVAPKASQPFWSPRTGDVQTQRTSSPKCLMSSRMSCSARCAEASPAANVSVSAAASHVERVFPIP
jgi:hypothetical protein